MDSQDSTYYSPAMAALPPPAERRRPRPGSLARPVNGRLYRGTWLLVALPLLVTAFTVARPGPLPAPPLPPVFDGATALQLAQDLALAHPDRSPGSHGRARGGGLAARAARALRPQRARGPLRGDDPRARPARAGQPDRRLSGPLEPGDRRDGPPRQRGTGPGANDNASGTAALIELARSYATTGSAGADAPSGRRTRSSSSRPTAARSEGSGAARFAGTSPYRNRTVAVVNLVALAGTAPPRIELAGDRPRSPAAALVRTAAARVLEQTGEELGRPSGDRAADRPRLPVHALRAGAVRRPRDLRDHAHDGRPAPAVVVHGHARPAEPSSA